MSQVNFLTQCIGDKKAVVIDTFDVKPLMTFADYFIIALAQNDRQLAAIVDEVRENVSDKRTLFVEGDPKSGWVVIQYDDTAAHLFLQNMHDEFRMDKLYHELLEQVNQ